MKPMWVIVCVCVGVDIVFISFLEMLRFPGAKKLIFPHFWHRIPHINWLLPQLCKKQKKKQKPSKLITVPSSGHTSLVHLCVTALTTEPAHLTNPVLADLKYLGWTQISTYMHLQIHWHTQFSLFVFFSPQMIDEYSFWCIDWMLLWNYIFGAGWALEERQIGLTKWE